MFICCDQLLGCWLRGWYYVWLGGEAPSADETISAWVGKRSVEGKRWAKIAEKVIDWIFSPGHCYRAIATDDLDQLLNHLLSSIILNHKRIITHAGITSRY